MVTRNTTKDYIRKAFILEFLISVAYPNGNFRQLRKSIYQNRLYEYTIDCMVNMYVNG